MLSTKPSILYVDDDEEARLMLTLLLGQQGYEVIAVNSSQAVRLITCGESFDLYILGLSRTDGAAFCRKIREFDRRTPIIIYSGTTQEFDLEVVLRVRGNMLIAKPQIDELLDAVRVELDI
jgi:DNA-binding response OmpR family regulator